MGDTFDLGKSDRQIRKSDLGILWDEGDERRPHMWVPNSTPQTSPVAIPRSRNNDSEIQSLLRTLTKPHLLHIEVMAIALDADFNTLLLEFAATPQRQRNPRNRKKRVP